MGASGSGKSTLLHVMAGLTRPDEGRILVDGNDLSAMSDYRLTLFRRRHIGLVFQAFNLIPTLTAEDNVLLPLLADGRAADGRRPRWRACSSGSAWPSAAAIGPTPSAAANSSAWPSPGR